MEILGGADEEPLNPEFGFCSEHVNAEDAERVNILIYNVTHIDVYFLVRFGPGEDDTELARATFSKFYETTLAVLRTIIGFKLKNKLKCIETISKEGENRLIGFDLSSAPVRGKSWDEFRLRRTPTGVKNYKDQPPRIVGVYFPLVAAILPVWLNLLDLHGDMLKQGVSESRPKVDTKRKAVPDSESSRSVRQKVDTGERVSKSRDTKTVEAPFSTPLKIATKSTSRKDHTKAFSSGSIFTTTATSLRRSILQSAPVKITSSGKVSSPPLTCHVTKSWVRATPLAAA